MNKKLLLILLFTLFSSNSWAICTQTQFNPFTGKQDFCEEGAGGSSNSFETISTSSGTSPVADSATDTLNLTAGSNITIIGDSSTDTVTISSTASGSTTESLPYNKITPPLTSHGIAFGSFTNTWTTTVGNATFFTIDGSGTDFVVQGDGDVIANSFTGPLVGNASTATALAANGANCSAGQYPLGVDASGNAESCTASSSGGISEVPYNMLKTPTTNTGINFAGFVNTWTSTTTGSDFFTINQTNTGFNQDALVVQAAEEDNGSFTFFKAISDSDGTPDTELTIAQDGTITMDGKLGVGRTAVTSVDISGAGTTLLRATNTTASSSTQGAGIQGVHDDGAAMASGDRLAFYTFGGATDASSTLVNGGAITGFATALWTGSSTPTEIRIETTPSGSTTRATAVTIESDKDVIVAGDVTIQGDDLFMTTNTSGAVLVADGTNFNPVVMSGACSVNSSGVMSCPGLLDTTSNVPYNKVSAPTTSHGIGFSTFTNTWTSAITASDFFTISMTGDFTAGNSALTLVQSGNPTGGSMLDIQNTDANVTAINIANGGLVVNSGASFVNTWTSSQTTGDFFSIGNTTTPIAVFRNTGELEIGSTTSESFIGFKYGYSSNPCPNGTNEVKIRSLFLNTTADEVCWCPASGGSGVRIKDWSTSCF
jgi:hypothetical protein